MIIMVNLPLYICVITCPDLHVISLITCHMKQEPYHDVLNTDVVHRTTIIHMVSEHMERDS